MKLLIHIFISLLIFGGCSKSDRIQFCEGVNTDGDGINCGKKFEDGELTAVINAGDPFGVTSITVQIMEIGDKKTEKLETLNVEVKPDKQTATANLSFYAGGKYLVRAMKKDVLIGEGEIEIVEK